MDKKERNLQTMKQIHHLKDKIYTFIVSILMLISVSTLFIMLYFVFRKGLPVLSLNFILSFPRNGMTEGGILPAIVGTFIVSILSVTMALPFGLMVAIYLSEYAKDNHLSSFIRISINNLAGTPSIIFGLFGLYFFVNYLGFGSNILSSSLTLAILILPFIIRTSEEALRNVPLSYREASYALGANKSTTILKIVLPSAMPGILTGIILSVGRVAGETAPILFTGATFFIKGLPTSLFSEFMALPYQIYALMTEGTRPDKQVPIAYGSAFVLIILVLLINFIAIYIRNKKRVKIE